MSSTPVFKQPLTPELHNPQREYDVHYYYKTLSQLKPNLSYPMKLSYPEDSQYATSSPKLWMLQQELSGEQRPQVHLRCSYNRKHQHNEQYNHFLRPNSQI